MKSILLGSIWKSCLQRQHFFLLALIIVGCARVKTDEPLIFCAASMAPVLETTLQELDLQADTHSGGSRVLLTQLTSGAQPNLVLLADVRLMKHLNPERILEQRVIASNQIVLVKVKGSNLTKDWQDALLDKSVRVAVANPDAAPLGLYTKQALTTLELQAETLTLNNANSVVSALISGHTDLGVVYLSDASRLEQLEVVHTFPNDCHDQILYTAILLKPESGAAKTIYNQLASNEGRAILESKSFQPPGSDSGENLP